MVRRTKADALETRSALLDAAEQLFSEQGVTNTSMMQVAEAANMTRGAIYHHFKNKLDLIDSLMERVRLPVDEMRCQVQANSPNNPLEQITLRSQKFIRHAHDDPHTRALVEILLHKCEYVDDVLPIKTRHLTGRNECITDVQQLFELAIEKQQLPKSVKPHAATVGLFSLIDGLMYNWLLDKDYFDLLSVAEQSIQAYLNGLARKA
ncbi:transcriptional regulator, TetR family [Pseudidiomarina planktonica]|uniref:Transcriptional regulator, TetR family n=1 Tax=Pseudidiomarina planktonica TaxID=1323738 RepID=A0A1Y6FWH9_9GAMM|nr:TetR family transcriptional regulator [Pseudidiomarina planktonica]RUO63978.1 multidrug transporter AcrB [Pseudidiomarina planktonica]SMQ79934.1 transcriptional regulator, TetR family [Pseudidiomarina planktonica]